VGQRSAGPLANLRVLDLAGPSGAYAGRLFAALGADVVLVEPKRGHAHRAAGSATFSYYHAGKRSVIADRRTTAGRRSIERLAARADVVVTTASASEARALGERHPAVVVASITPFGHQGPLAAWAASDTVLQAMGGLAYVNGRPDAAPLRVLGNQAQHQAGIFAVVGALTMLLGGRARDRLVDVSMQAAVAAALEHVPALYLGGATIPKRQATLHWTRAFRAGRCLDGWVLHSTMGDWTSLASWVVDELGCDGFGLRDPRWNDPAQRRADAEVIFRILDRWAARKTVDEITERAQMLRLPFAALRRPSRVTAHPQLEARAFFDGPSFVPGAPFLLDGERPASHSPPPLGAHDRAVATSWLETPRDARSPGRLGRGARPLAALRVLDFTWVVAGPVATRILSDLGARVIKVEHPATDRTDDARGGFAGMLMRGKESVALDLRSESGRHVARELAARVDVVADNFSARVMGQLGLDAERLRATRPSLVCLGMTGYGRTGPWADRVSYGPTLQADVGFTLGMADEDGSPLGLGYSYSDLASGNLAAAAVLASLWRRERDARGATLDFSQLEALAGLMDPSIGADDGPAPDGIYPAAGDDRWIALTVRSDDEWRRFAVAIGRDTLGTDPSLATAPARRAARATLDATIAGWTRTRPACEAAALLQTRGIPAGPVADARDLLDDDAQLSAREHVVRVPTPEGGTVRLDSIPIRVAGLHLTPSAPGPIVGEHSRSVLADVLGLLPTELDRLEADGAIVQWRSPLG